MLYNDRLLNPTQNMRYTQKIQTESCWQLWSDIDEVLYDSDLNNHRTSEQKKGILYPAIMSNITLFDIIFNIHDNSGVVGKKGMQQTAQYSFTS